MSKGDGDDDDDDEEEEEEEEEKEEDYRSMKLMAYKNLVFNA